MGVPLDIGTSNRSGTRYGPRQIRTESALIRSVNISTGMSIERTLTVVINVSNLLKTMLFT